MALNNDLPYRRSHRLPGFDYRQPGAYFITLCTHGREHRFGDIVDGRMRLNAAGRMLQSLWRELPAHYPNLDIDAFMVMPDHFHGIVLLHPDVGALLAAPAECEKSPVPAEWPNLRSTAIDHGTTRDGFVPGAGAASSAPTLGQILRRFKSTSAIAVNRTATAPGRPLWQRDYWERVLRSDQECAAVRRYIQENPRRWQAKMHACA